MKYLWLIFAILILSSVSSYSQTVSFKPATGNPDSVNAFYGLKFDSIQVYSYALQKEKTITTFEKVNLSDFSSVKDDYTKETGILNINFDNQNIAINYFLPASGNYILNVYDLSGATIFSSQLNPTDTKITFKSNQLHYGTYFASIYGNNQVYSEKFIYPINSSFINNSRKILFKDKIVSDDNLFRIKAYSHNRTPVTIDSLVCKNGDLIRIKFDYEFPYRFIDAIIYLSVPDCEIIYSWFKSQENHTETLHGYSADRYYTVSSISNNTIIDDTMSCILGYQYSGQYGSHYNGGLVKFYFKDNNIENLFLGCCTVKSDEEFITSENFYISAKQASYSFYKNKLKIAGYGIDKLSNFAMKVDLSSNKYMSYSGSKSVSKYSLSGASLNITMTLF